MKHLSPTEKGAVILGLGFVIVGVCLVVHPTEGIVVNPSPLSNRDRPSWPVHISRRGTQIYGGIAIVIGVGLSWLAFYRGKR
jgi:hypothetical protein